MSEQINTPERMAIAYLTQIANDHIATLSPAAKQATAQLAQQSINTVEAAIVAKETLTARVQELQVRLDMSGRARPRKRPPLSIANPAEAQ